MIKFAIVGNIASGKSTMEKILEKYGYVVLDTDFMTHDILIDNPEVSKAFSEYDVFEYGKLSREKLGALVFSDNDLKTKLEEIIHPLIKKELEMAFETFKNEPVLFISVPLLFEVGWENMFDKIVFINSEDSIRKERLVSLRGYTQEYAQKRIDSQMSQEDKIKKSDYVVQNNGSIDEYIGNIEQFIKTIQQNQ